MPISQSSPSMSVEKAERGPKRRRVTGKYFSYRKLLQDAAKYGVPPKDLIVKGQSKSA